MKSTSVRHPQNLLRGSYSWVVVILLFASLFIPSASAGMLVQPASPAAAAPVAPLDAQSEVTVDFPVGMEIATTLAWPTHLDGAAPELLYTVGDDETATLAFATAMESAGSETVHVTVDLYLQAQAVPAGVTIEFRWRAVDSGVILAESLPERTSWLDTRWDWTVERSDQVRVHSYRHGPAFVREVLDAAQSTVTQLETRFGLARSETLDIWVYPSNEDFLGAQQPNTRESIAGASYPGYELIVAVVPNGSTAEIGRVIQHEISHQVLHQATENPFTYPPLWFDEGLATHFQVGGTDGYLEMVVRAHRDDALYSIASLDASFPYLPAQATLAYATSWSVVEYIEVTYGDDGIAALIAAFATGTPYEEAIIQALGVDGAGLEHDWRAWIATQDS